MNIFEQEIKSEQNRISKLLDLMDDYSDEDKQGVLVLHRKNGNIYCYERSGDSKKYLGKNDSDAAKEYVKRRFLTEKHSRLITDREILNKLMRQYQEYSFDAVMSGLPGSFRAIVNEDFNNSRYEELKQWANADYKKNDAPFPDNEIYTKDGLRVRSRGECLHANIYSDIGIPFRYDCMIRIEDEYGNAKDVSPDFMIQCYNRQLVIIEHLGRLFDKQYALRFGEKCYWYLQAGFVLGKNFFVTSDDIKGGIDTREIWEVAKAVERLFFAK